MTPPTLQTSIADLVPDNVHPIPVALSYERDPKTGCFLWCVYIEVSSPSHGWLDTFAQHIDMYRACDIALANVKRNISNNLWE